MTRHTSSALADRRQRLATAIAATLMFPSAAAMATGVTPSAQGQQVADGSVLALDPDDYATSNDGETVLIAKNRGTIAAYDPITIVSTGQQAIGAQATGEGSTVTLVGSVVVTSGNDAAGLEARDGGKINATSGEISTGGIGSHAVNVTGTGAEAVVARSNLRTTGAAASALNIERGGRATVVLGSLQTTGASSNGVTISGAGSQVQLDRVEIATQGEHARGVYIASNASGAQIEIKGRAAENTPVTITTGGDFATGVEIDGADNTLTLADVVIETQGQGARGIHLDGNGHTMSADAVRITSTGADAEAISNRGGTVEVRDSVLTTSGARSHGLYAGQSTTQGFTPVTRADRVTIETHGTSAAAAYAAAGGHMHVSNSTLTVRGQGSGGFVIRGGRSEGTLTDSVVRAEGSGSMGISVQEGARVNASGVDVLATGAGSAALVAAMGTPSVQSGIVDPSMVPLSRVTLVNSRLTATAGTAVHMIGGNSAIDLDGVEISGRDGAIHYADHANNALTMGSISAKRSTIIGDVSDTSTGRSVLELDAGSLLQGATDGLDSLTLSGNSRWDMTSSSNVGDLVVSNSGIHFPAAGAGSHATLTVSGNYHGDNALLAMNTHLYDDASVTDRMHVLGDTSGVTRLQILNAGGAGAQTRDGIEVITVDGASNGQFILDGRAVAGAYEYFLHKGGKADPGNGDWYLRSELDTCPSRSAEGCTVDPPVDPGTGPGPGPGPGPILRPEPGAYLALQALTMGAMRHSLHDRLGEPVLDMRDSASGVPGAAWARVQTDQLGFDVAGQVKTRSRNNQLQVGSNLVYWGSQGYGVAGIMASAVQGSVTSQTLATGYQAGGRLRGQVFGIYGTWYGSAEMQPGWYVDTSVQHGRFRQEVTGDALVPERYRTKATSVSVEGGHAFQVLETGEGRLLLEPQLQLTYLKTPGIEHAETNGTQVLTREAGGLQTRVGVRVFGHSSTAEHNVVQPFVTLNWYRNQRGNSVAFDGDVLSGGEPRDAFEAKVGAQLQLGPRLSGWGQAGLRKGSGGYLNAGGQIGVKYSW